MLYIKNFILIILLLFFFLPIVYAETDHTHLRVATRDIPPFAMMDEHGNWTGITIELLDLISAELGFTYELEPMSIIEMLEGLQDGSIDMAAAAVSITSERETLIDFSHPFYYTGLGIATTSTPGASLWKIIHGMVSQQFLQALGALILILFLFGFLIWLFERKKNSSQFDKNAYKGIGAGFWWSAVTITTVGYGDKAPATVGGRIIAFICMFFGIIIASTITATIASSLTVASLDTGITGPRDLPGIKAGAIRGTTSADYFYDKGMSPVLYDSAHDALQALDEGKIEAFVYDAPIMEYLIRQNYQGTLTVLPQLFNHQKYGIGIPFNSPMRQDINRALLSIIETGRFERIKRRYLGENQA